MPQPAGTAAGRVRSVDHYAIRGMVVLTARVRGSQAGSKTIRRLGTTADHTAWVERGKGQRRLTGVPADSTLRIRCRGAGVLENPEAEERGDYGSEGEQSQDVFERAFGWIKFRDINHHPTFEVAFRTGRPLADEFVAGNSGRLNSVWQGTSSLRGSTSKQIKRTLETQYPKSSIGRMWGDPWCPPSLLLRHDTSGHLLTPDFAAIRSPEFLPESSPNWVDVFPRSR
jgi:hypothetical protein